MRTAALIAVTLVAIIHVGIMYLEMALWTKPYGLKAFGNSAESAKSSATLASNQGLYNGFLAAGLFWSLTGPDNARQITLFFLGCVMVAGLYGAATAKRSILFIQFLPAAVTMGLILAT